MRITEVDGSFATDFTGAQDFMHSVSCRLQRTEMLNIEPKSPGAS